MPSISPEEPASTEFMTQDETAVPQSESLIAPEETTPPSRSPEQPVITESSSEKRVTEELEVPRSAKMVREKEGNGGRTTMIILTLVLFSLILIILFISMLFFEKRYWDRELARESTTNFSDGSDKSPNLETQTETEPKMLSSQEPADMGMEKAVSEAFVSEPVYMSEGIHRIVSEPTDLPF
jgi:hypothetical protein